MSSDTTFGAMQDSETGSAPARLKDVSLMVERVAIKGLDKLSRRLGLVLAIVVGFLALEFVYRMKFISIHEPWWVFQVAQTEYFVDTRTVYFALRWIAPLVLGIIATLACIQALSAASSERSRRGRRVGQVGLLVSIAAVAVLALDMFGIVDMGKPTSQVWLYPVSFMGMSAAMISLAMSRESGPRDERLSILAALVPVALMVIPSVAGYHEPALSDLALAVYLLSAVAYFLSGQRLDTLYQGLTFDKFSKWAGIAMAFALALVGVITNGPRSFFVDLRWIGAASAGLVLSLFVAWMVRKPNAANASRKPTEGPEMAIATLGLTASLILVVLFLLNSTGVLDLGAPDWFFPASIIGVALAMVSLTLLGTGNAWDRAVSFCAIGLALVVLGLPVIRGANPEWTGYFLAVIGIIALVYRLQSPQTSSIPVKLLAKRRKLLNVLTMAGLVASAVLVALFVMFKVGTVQSEGPYIGAALAVTALTMIALLLTRTTKAWEKVATIAVVAAAVLGAAMSSIAQWSPTMHPGTVAALYVGAALLLLLGGLRPVTMYSGAGVMREKAKLAVGRTWKVVTQVLKNPMGIVGSVILIFFIVLAAFGPELAPYNIPTGAGHPGIDQWEKYLKPSETRVPAPSYIVDVIWGMPLFAALLSAAALLGFGSRKKAKGETKPRSPIMVAALILSGGLLALAVLDALNILELGRPEWLYPASAAGAFLVMLTLATSDFKLERGGYVGLGLLGASFALIVAPVFLGSSSLTRAQELFVSYLFAGVFMVAAGVLFHSSIRKSSGWVGGAVPSSARLVRGLGIGFAGVLIVVGILAMLEGSWTQHWMGTDTFGYDTFSELLYGARTSIIVGIISAVIASVLGALVGLYSGYVGGWADEVIMRMNDVVLSIPWLVLMIIVAAMIGTIDLTGIILIIGLTGWSTTARMVRAQVLSIRERQYIERARAIGSPDLAIIRRHVLPNAFPLVFANTILTVAVSILSEATLSFLGMRPVGVTTWGTMLSYASSANAFAIGLHWWIVAPGMCIVVIVLGFTLLGYALDDVLNPKLRKR